MTDLISSAAASSLTLFIFFQLFFVLAIVSIILLFISIFRTRKASDPKIKAAYNKVIMWFIFLVVSPQVILPGLLSLLLPAVISNFHIENSQTLSTILLFSNLLIYAIIFVGTIVTIMSFYRAAKMARATL